MMILEPELVDFGYEAITSHGSREAIRFQKFFYAFNRKFQDLKAAVESCRHEMDRHAVVSLVIDYLDHAEIWVKVDPEATVIPKAGGRSHVGTGDSAADKAVYFRGQPVEALPPAPNPQQAQPVYFRGQRASQDPALSPKNAPKRSSYRGVEH